MHKNEFIQRFVENNFPSFLRMFQEGDYDIVKHWFIDGNLPKLRKSDPIILQYSDTEISSRLSQAYYSKLYPYAEDKLKSIDEFQDRLNYWILRNYYIDDNYSSKGTKEFDEKFRIERIHGVSGELIKLYKLKEFLEKLKKGTFDLQYKIMVSNDDTAKNETIYNFTRTLRGGIVEDFQGGTFISEGTIRSKGYAHGDKLRCIFKTEHRDGINYDFEIVSRGSGDAPGRCQVNSAFVEFEDDKYILRYHFDYNSSTPAEILLLGEPHTFLIPRKEVEDYSITEGMIVDFAYCENNPDIVKILWKHSTTNDLRSPKISSFYKQSPNFDSDEDEDTTPVSTFEMEVLRGRTVAVIGGDPRHPTFRDVFARLGIGFIGVSIDRNVSQSTLTSNFRNADVIVVNNRFDSHDVSIRANAVAKELGIPIRNIHSFGIATTLRAAAAGLLGTRIPTPGNIH